MIVSFVCRDTKRLFEGQFVRKFGSFAEIARRKLTYLDAATELQDLKVPPGNRLEALSGERKGQYSIRINNQWRLCFQWQSNNAHNVEIIDYH